MTDGFRPLPGERGVRFGCGAIAGALLGFFLAIRETGAESFIVVIIAVVSAIVLGYLAARYGDRLWESMSKWLWWLQ